MSRIGKNPIVVPKGVEVTTTGGQISVKGPLGVIARPLDPNVGIEREGENLQCKVLGNSRHAKAMFGTVRALVSNMVVGVTKGWERKLQLVGVGYRAQAQGDKLNLTLDFSTPMVHQKRKRVQQPTPPPTERLIPAASTQTSGHSAAEVRAGRSPKPYADEAQHMPHSNSSFCKTPLLIVSRSRASRHPQS